MLTKKQNPGKRANAARATYHTIRRSKFITQSNGVSIFGNQIDLQSATGRAYSSSVAANSATGLGRSNLSRRTGALHPKTGAFFVPVTSRYGSCARDSFGGAGCLESRSANPRTVATLICLAANGGSSPTLGATPMIQLHALNPSARSIRAAAHKAMAFAALRANSSLSTRLKRYNHHMQLAHLAASEQAMVLEVHHA